eukprot:scaffold2428_cov412-Prasinococcus_capsulatus_cf.AAC.19
MRNGVPLPPIAHRWTIAVSQRLDKMAGLFFMVRGYLGPVAFEIRWVDDQLYPMRMGEQRGVKTG